MNDDRTDVATLAGTGGKNPLNYAPPPEPVAPAITDDGSRLEINLGSAGQATFATRIALMGLVLAGSVAACIFSSGWERFLYLLYGVTVSAGLFFAIRSRLIPDVIVADADGITARGPTAGAVQVARADIVGFRARRDACFWLTQLRVRLVPNGLSGGSEHVVALAKRADVLRAVDQLNGWMARSPVPVGRGVPARVRVQNYAILALSLAVTIAIAVHLGRAGIGQDPDHTFAADLYFIAAITVVAFPNLLLYGTLSCRGSTATTPPKG